MDITINVPDAIGKELKKLPNSNNLSLKDLEFVLEKHRQQFDQTTPKQKTSGKWRNIAEEFHRESPLHGLSDEVNKASRDFRDNFSFNNDL